MYNVITMNIPELKEKINTVMERLKSREFYTVVLILLVGLASFGLGRLSKLEEARVPIRIEQQSASTVSSFPPDPFQRGSTESARGRGFEEDTAGVSSANGQELAADNSSAPAQGGQIVASRNGNKYHFPWCSGAQKIAEANKIWFSSIEEAREAGYTPASNCKGLK